MSKKTLKKSIDTGLLLAICFFNLATILPAFYGAYL